MDRENFNAIITRYLEKFELTNDSKNAEWFKWEAIDCFQKNWDIDAEDLYDSFSRAIAGRGMNDSIEGTESCFFGLCFLHGKINTI